MKNYLFVFLIVLTNCTKKEVSKPVEETLNIEKAKLQISAVNRNINTINLYYTDNQGSHTVSLLRSDLNDGTFSISNDIVSDNSNLSESLTLNYFLALKPLNSGSVIINAGSDLSGSGGVKKITISQIELLEINVEDQATVDQYIANQTAGRDYARVLINQAKTRSFFLDIY